MSGYRLFIGQLVRDVRRREIEDAFSKFGEIVRIDIKNGFGFVEYEHSRDAEEAIRKMDGEEFLGRRIIVEYARGRRRDRERGGRDSRSGNNGPERSDYRVIVEGLGRSTSWQDLKDAFRSSGDILFTDVRRDRYDEYYGIVEFRYKEDIDHAIRKMDGAEVNGHKIRVKEDRKRGRSSSRDRKKRRSKSREKRSGSRKRRSGSRDRRSPSKEKERERRSPSKERDRRSPSKEKERERRSPSKERDRRSPSKERERTPSKERERRSPSKEKERERRSGSRDSKPREGSEERQERKRSRSTENKAEEEDKERETKRSKQEEEREPEKEHEDN